VKKEHIFDDIDAYITSNIDNGLVVISGRPAENVSMKNAENAIWKQFDNLKTEFVEQKELTKTLSSLEFGVEYLKTNIMTKTRLLGYYELLGNIDLINTEKDKYENVNEKQIKLAAQRIFQAQKVSVLYYLKAQKK
jgi:predicted Zn-dependent peptidase